MKTVVIILLLFGISVHSKALPTIYKVLGYTSNDGHGWTEAELTDYEMSVDMDPLSRTVGKMVIKFPDGERVYQIDHLVDSSKKKSKASWIIFSVTNDKGSTLRVTYKREKDQMTWHYQYADFEFILICL